jgi:glycosyltransferase involved in cell wall biosynthesis
MTTTPLRIAHIANEPFGIETASGIAQVVHCLARAQAETGQSVAVFSRDDHGFNVFGDRNGSPSPSAAAVGGARGWSLRQRWLARQVEWPGVQDLLAWKPHIVHFHSVHIPQNVGLAGSLCGERMPYCVTVHGALFPEALRRNRLKKAFFTLAFERRFLNEARFVHALTPHESNAIRRCGVVSPIVEAPNGPPPDLYAKTGQPDALFVRHPELRDRTVFMFVGRLDTWQKGLDLLVDAFADPELRDASLVLVGPDWRGSRRDLARRAERRGILSRLVFVDAVYGDARANLLAGADIFVHPSRWEGLSMSVLAASAAGKPSLLTAIADPLGRLDRARAAVIVEASVSSIAAGLKRAAALTGSERQAMGKRARHVAETHITWPEVARKFVQAYQRAVTERQALHL